LIPIKPGASRRSVAPRPVIEVVATLFYCSDTFHQLGASGNIVSAYNDGGA
jgi:hypothetical protein